MMRNRKRVARAVAVDRRRMDGHVQRPVGLLPTQRGPAYASGRLSEVSFLVGRTVVDVRDERIVFDAGTEAEPRLYADVGPSVCVGREGEPLPVAGLVRRTVASAATAGGALMLTFVDGATLRCDPSEDYEAWQVVGGSPEHLVVCMPGGELAVWDDRTPSIPLAEARERDPAGASALDEMLKTLDMPRPTGFPPADKS
jgi:hypothetical protein